MVPLELNFFGAGMFFLKIYLRKMFGKIFSTLANRPLQNHVLSKSPTNSAYLVWHLNCGNRDMAELN
jgi:hypothetical protein